MTPGVSEHLGAKLIDETHCHFRVWAPLRDRVELHIVSPREQRITLTKLENGYHEGIVECGEGTRYYYNVNGTNRPDPASRLQPT